MVVQPPTPQRFDPLVFVEIAKNVVFQRDEWELRGAISLDWQQKDAPEIEHLLEWLENKEQSEVHSEVMSGRRIVVRRPLQRVPPKECVHWRDIDFNKGTLQSLQPLDQLTNTIAFFQRQKKQGIVRSDITNVTLDMDDPTDLQDWWTLVSSPSVMLKGSLILKNGRDPFSWHDALACLCNLGIHRIQKIVLCSDQSTKGRSYLSAEVWEHIDELAEMEHIHTFVVQGVDECTMVDEYRHLTRSIYHWLRRWSGRGMERFALLSKQGTQSLAPSQVFHLFMFAMHGIMDKQIDDTIVKHVELEDIDIAEGCPSESWAGKQRWWTTLLARATTAYVRFVHAPSISIQRRCVVMAWEPNGDKPNFYRTNPLFVGTIRPEPFACICTRRTSTTFTTKSESMAYGISSNRDSTRYTWCSRHPRPCHRKAG